MASYLLNPSTILKTLNNIKPHSTPSNNQITLSFFQNTSAHFISNPKFTNKTSPHLHFHPKSSSSSSLLLLSSNRNLENLKKNETLLVEQHSPVKSLFLVFLWASVYITLFAFGCGDAKAQQAQAAVQSIKASSFGLKVANFLSGSGWPGEAVVFALATLPVIELRGAIPVGYWFKLNPVVLTALAVLGLVHFLNIIFI
ncbi:putative small multi-drug export [Helianthus annuus]|nr:putative small multi-drug export [Helianthus annuus]KAJ0631885.1 putative small multi-drug export [Helianthus annuus]